jgi:hypothetical protein
MSFGPEEDLRAELTDAIYQEGAEHGPYERSKGSCHRVRQIEMDRNVVPLLVSEQQRSRLDRLSTHYIN